MHVIYLLTAGGGALLVALGNMLWWQSLPIGLLAGGLYLYCSTSLLALCLRESKQPYIRFLVAFGLWLAVFATVSGLVYKAFNLSTLTVYLLLGLLLVAQTLFTVKYRTRINNASIPQVIAPITSLQKGLMVGILLFIGYQLLSTLQAAATTEPIRSPWHVIDPAFFVFLFVFSFVALSLLTLPSRYPQAKNTLVLVLLTGSTLSIGLVVYQIGYGFDSFIHQATEKLIAAEGVVYPKPLYYLGQYGLIVSLHKLLLLPVAFIDRLLLPLLAAIFLPTILCITLASQKESPFTVALTSVSLLSLPLTLFIATTPQGIANMLLLAVIFTSFFLPNARTVHWLLAITATVVHPLGGIPALMLVSLKELRRFMQNKSYAKKHISTATLITGGVYTFVLPLLFFLQEWLQPTAGTGDYLSGETAALFPHGLLYLHSRYQLVLDSVYGIGFNLPAIIAVLATIGGVMLYRKQQLQQHIASLTMIFVLLLNAIIMQKWLPFSFLISYERGDFALRVATLSLFFALPFAAIALLTFYRKLEHKPKYLTLFFVLVLAVFHTVTVYLSYPRFDTYSFDRGYSTGSSDLVAVDSIDQQTNEPYIVLANQSVSAAVLRQLGFKQTFTDSKTGQPMFFYPIPTGGVLYQYYLRMVYEAPLASTVIEAMDRAKVNEAYFVLNAYWFNSELIANEAKDEANEWWSIDDDILVFKFTR